MNNYSLKVFATVIAIALLSACGPGAHLKYTNVIFNGGMDVPEQMRNRHLAGYVAFDETFAGNYSRIARNALYGQGVIEGTPEYLLRIVRMNLSVPSRTLLVSYGEITHFTAAVVPDHLPPLKAGDIVEIRHLKIFNTIENFTTTGEGNIVVRILCAKCQPDYDDCVENRTPRVGKIKGVGETHTSYPASVKDYGFTFSQAYNPDGTPFKR